jgi:N-acetyl-anhydromuramyl-L-alanine amidase AmpD
MITFPVRTEYRTVEGDYFKEETEKTGIVLHHSAGGTLVGLEATLRAKDYKAVAYGIDKTGVVYNFFDCKYWAYHLGVSRKGFPRGYFDKRFIGVEIVNEGALLPDPDDPSVLGLSWNPKIHVCSISDESRFYHYGAPWRGYEYYARYSGEQVEASAQLSAYLTVALNLPRQTAPVEALQSEELNWEAVDAGGVCTHINFRDAANKQDLSLAFPWNIFMRRFYEELETY